MPTKTNKSSFKNSALSETALSFISDGSVKYLDLYWLATSHSCQIEAFQQLQTFVDILKGAYWMRYSFLFQLRATGLTFFEKALSFEDF